jgi:RNA polymerase sigma-70 factor (ECF subfamily)
MEIVPGGRGNPPLAPPAEDGDLALARALIAGRPGAFEPFVDRFGPLILNFGRRMCGHLDDADDLLQETLLKAYQSARTLREPAALKTWIYRIAASICLKMRRGAKRQPKRNLPLDVLLPRQRRDGRPPDIPDWSDIPLERLLQGELRRRIESAIAALPKDYRAVLVLRDQEGFTTREAAGILGISETLAKVRLHRARLALRKGLEAHLGRGAARAPAAPIAPAVSPPHARGAMSCREMAGYLSDYLDGELQGSLRRAIDAHGGECPPCRAFVRTLHRTVEALRAQPRIPLPPALRRRLAEALKACPPA